MSLETVLVTGAAGTIGGYVVRELVARGHHVVATDLPGSRFDFGLPPSAVEARRGDVTDLTFCVEVTRGVGSVIHLAATIDLGLARETMWRINVDAVRYMYEAARSRGCRRFVFYSSASIYQKGHGVIDERTAYDARAPYEQSKLEAERHLRSRPRSGPEVTILRPSMIYGPRARFLAAKLATLPPVLSLAFPAIPRLEGGPRCNWAHAEDAARAAVLLLTDERAAWEVYNVADETPMDLGEVLETITRAYGLPIGRTVRYPRRLLRRLAPALADQELFVRAVSAVYERLWRRIVQREGLDGAIDPSIDREVWSYATTEAIFDTSKLKALGFEAKWKSLREGYPAVLGWFQEHRWVPTYQEPIPVRPRRGEVGASAHPAPP